ncbi:putative C4-dicarboxylate response regulator DctR [[Clostridium] ultunense Esp]|uniref:response regulator n=1 Tax=Thermicanus aegyptius TaxID=94009 RepID=UPI0002B70862|nr:response regulator [Thermicanus aegyptius]CCQ97448.1 putative C4-dicarboxylate response regulator DctR [[Clostridium] ultunense Esp]
MASQDFIRILLVEDDPMVLEINRSMVQKIPGFLITGTANNGVKALQLIPSLKPDLLLLDIFMPEQDGLKTLKKIRQGNPSPDVILITAAEESRFIHEALQNGAFDYIIKPFTYERLKQALLKYREYRKLRSHKKVSQEELDRLLFSSVKKEEELPKGLTPLTLYQIRSFLAQQRKSLSAEEVAQAIGIARVTARRYLDYLVQQGDVELEIQYGSVGRPIHRYLCLRCDQYDQN